MTERTPVSTLTAALAQRLGGDSEQAQTISALLPEAVPADWRALSAVLTTRLARAADDRCLVFGLSGGQGAGKSTLAQALVLALQHCGLRAASLSLDDVYLTAAARARLATDVHPLLRTRGVPGSHDLPLLQSVLDRLSQQRLRLPAFNKAADDRLPESAWPEYQGPIQVLVLEGWCLGASPQPDAMVAEPVNALERDEDPDGRYRRLVNDALAGPYQALWQQLDAWLFLAVPSMAAVHRWRTEQEQHLPLEGRMSNTALHRFIQHYERLTNWLLQTAPHKATWTLQLDEDHKIRLD